MVAKRKDISKIVVAKTMDEAVGAIEAYKPILAFSGPFSTEDLNFQIPYADAKETLEKLADIVENRLLKKDND